jgi:hypothetical protein
MKSLAVVVEGRRDALVLKHLLADSVEQLRFFVAGGKASAVTVARNVLFHEDVSVLLVADADTDSKEQAGEQKRTMLIPLQAIAPVRRADVFLFMPELECVFFETSMVSPTPELAKLQELAEGGMPDKPKVALIAALEGHPLEDWIASLPNEFWVAARRVGQASELIRAVKHLEQ